ncbi:Uncharacterised protein [Mycobacteroides abscessus subsp. abscessus]|nr:Uncharacterised protein [Mycobacteroides abscessus subsp. abscessus]
MSVAPWWVNWLAMVCLMTAVSAPMGCVQQSGVRVET